jgi:integrase
MFLTLYRRHRRNCILGHPEDSQTLEPEERKKGYKHCDCYIVMAGTLSKKFDRRNTKEREWDKAHVKSRAQEALGSWANTVAVVEPKPDSPARMSIAEASAAWKNKKLNPAVNPSVAYQRKVPLLLHRFDEFSKHKGYLWMDQWKLADVEAFRFSWPHQQSTAIATMVLLKEFFRYCLDNEWIVKNPAAKYKEAKPKKGDAEKEDHKPFTEERMEEMLAACKRYGGPRHTWQGGDVEDFINLSVATGLRISDMVMFDAKRLLPSGEIHLRTKKNGEKVCIWVEPWLQDRIRERARIYGSRIFGTFQSTKMNSLTQNWRKKCDALWALCSPWAEDDNPHPHRFRHTFARRILESDEFTFRDLAELLGDTEATVRKYYSQWVPSRQNLLTQKMKRLHAARSSENVVSISAGKVS